METEIDTQTEATATSKRGTLRVIRFLVGAFILFAAIYLVWSTVALFSGDTLFSPLELTLAPSDVLIDLPEGASVYDAQALVEVEADFGQRLVWWLVTDAIVIFALVWLCLAWRILARNELFTEANASRLRIMIIVTLILAGISLFRPAASIYLQGELGLSAVGGIWDFTDLFIALGLAGLLEVWRHGIALKTEQELTI